MGSSLSLQLIVGLGNPGLLYQNTRHNVGFWVLDQLAGEYRLDFRHEARFQGNITRYSTSSIDCWLLKPQTFMNLSGLAVSSCAHYYKIPAQRILVIHDELDFMPGVARLKFGGGLGGHNGLKSIAQQLNTQDFWRLRLGIGRPVQGQGMQDYVLHPPQRSEQIAINQVVQNVLLQWDAILAGQFSAVMNQLHQTV